REWRFPGVPRVSRRLCRPRHADGACRRAPHSRLRTRPKTQSWGGLLMSGVVVTGVGLVTSVGVGTGAAWKAMLGGREGAGEIPYFDTSAYKVHRAHVIREVGLDTTPHELACMAACEAVRDAGLDVARARPER